MATTVNNVQTSTSASLSYTPSSVSDAILVVYVSSEDVSDDNPITACSFGATPMTLGVIEDTPVGTNSNDIAGFYLVSPGTSTLTISVTGGESARTGLVAMTLGGVSALDVTGTNGSTSARTAAPVGATTTGNGIAVSACSYGATSAITISGGATQQANFTPTSSRLACGTEIITGATSYLHGFTGASDRLNSATMAFSEATGGPTYSLTLDSGTYTLTGQSVGLTAQRTLALNTGSYALTGNDVTLTYTPITGPTYTLVLDPGSYTLTGNDTSLLANRSLALDSGSYTVTGNAVDFVYTPISGPTYTLLMDTGSYAVTGNETGLIANRKLALDSGAYSLTGQVVGLTYSGDLWNIQSDVVTNWTAESTVTTTWSAQADTSTTWTIR